MSHNRTQPEEIDHIWWAMANHDMATETPFMLDMKLDGTMRDVKQHEFGTVTNLPVAYKKSVYGLPDALPYVWSM